MVSPERFCGVKKPIEVKKCAPATSSSLSLSGCASSGASWQFGVDVLRCFAVYLLGLSGSLHTGVLSMGFPGNCDDCIRAKTNAGLFHGEIEFKLRPFIGTRPSVLLAGQDPTMAEREVNCVLDLENEDGELYRHIVTDTLEPANLGLDNVYATDLIKCRFPDNQKPKLVAENHGMEIEDFLLPFFSNCRKWFLEEIEEIRPKIILSFGQPVHRMLIEEFAWPVPSNMKEAFSRAYEVEVPIGHVLYLPCVYGHTVAVHPYYKNLWPRFIQNLKEAVISAAIT